MLKSIVDFTGEHHPRNRAIKEAVNPMSIRFKYSLPALLQLSAVVLAASPSMAAWQSGVSYGGTLKMDLYTPSKPAASPAILVAIHYCTGNSGSAHSWFQTYADQYGFYIIAPDAGKQCFDSSATRGGDRDAIVKMVQWVITNKSADKTRVFAAGLSSGGCMTNTLLAIYPDVFAAGAAMPGFPAGGWPAGDTTCTKCGSSPPNKSAKEWGDIARGAFSYSGARPRVQEWVSSKDEYNFNGWLPAVVLQFQDLLGLGSGTKATGPSGWDRTEYKDNNGTVMLQTNISQSSNTVKHDLQPANVWGEVIKFLGLDKQSSSTDGSGGAGGTSSFTSTGGKASAGGAGGASATSSKAVSDGGAGGAASSSKANSSSAKSTGGASAATGGASGRGGSANEKGGTSASSSKVSSKGGESAKGGASSAAQEEGGAASNTEEASSGGSEEQQTSAAQSKGGSKSASSKADSAKGGGAETTANAQQNQTPPDDGGGCSLMAREGSTGRGALAGLAAVLVGLASSRRRRRRRSN